MATALPLGAFASINKIPEINKMPEVGDGKEASVPFVDSDNTCYLLDKHGDFLAIGSSVAITFDRQMIDVSSLEDGWNDSVPGRMEWNIELNEVKILEEKKLIKNFKDFEKLECVIQRNDNGSKIFYKGEGFVIDISFAPLSDSSIVLKGSGALTFEN